MKTKDQKKIMKIIWIVTDIIILIAAILLMIDGGVQERIIALIGFILLIAELYLYKKGRLLK